MKTKNLFAIMMFVFPVLLVLLVSCEKNEPDDDSFDFNVHDFRVTNVLYPKGSKLKRVYQVFNDGSRLLRPEYSYDEMGRISRVDWVFEAWKQWDEYLYNKKGQLEKISSYEAYLENLPDLRQTIVYSYDTEGNKIKEQTEWPAGKTYNLYRYNDKKLVRQEHYENEQQKYYIIYEYNGKKLVKQEHYEEEQQKYYIVYEYKGNMLKKEKLFVPDSPDYVTTEHFYGQNLLIYSITYHEDPKSGFMNDERRYYDKNDNLIKTISNHPGLSSHSEATAFYVTWEYEYE